MIKSVRFFNVGTLYMCGIYFILGLNKVLILVV
jgi:hypothetical protein